ncbi:hypothetical protein GNX71_12925 [Variovorax sp. RKNM96]|uniref:hypothetical protein n=1 Tax=Variovorax sp. RKNM96 TaxID=2681552 RepID=UPI00197FB139|nr:hypothetical protein [Variovorax sp. RKNM96]QSI30438.1 hypothetical protein GNX71_12925 [Variovorax sp. RKNM96]
MSFLDNLASFGTVETTRSYSYSKHLDPVQRLRMNFIQNAKRQVADLKSGTPLSTNAWISKKAVGGGRFQYKVSLRVGPKLVKLPGGTHVKIDSQDNVIRFLEGIIQACEDGELDHLLQETAGKGKDAEQPDADEALMSN